MSVCGICERAAASQLQSSGDPREEAQEALDLDSKNPKKLQYKSLDAKPLNCVTHLRVAHDAAFKKETDIAHSLRGALFLRGACSDQKDLAWWRLQIMFISSIGSASHKGM